MDKEWQEKKEFAKRRNTPTPAERSLWNELRSSKTGFKFSREIAIGPYFADFCCRSRKLVVEIDGESHQGRSEEDEAKDAGLRSRGYQVLRFTNHEVTEKTAEIVSLIIKAAEERPQFRY